MSFYSKSKRGKKDKGFFQKIHARKRVKERFGFSAKTISLFESMIRNGKASFISKQSNRISHHDIKYKGKTVRCVYDKIRGNIVTVLTDDMVQCQ